jgi:predicted enzyme related to lactoylglutathione lyase
MGAVSDPGGGSIALQPRADDPAAHVSLEVTGIKDFVDHLKAKGARVIEEICQQEHSETALLADPSGNIVALIDTATSKFPHD